MARTRAPQGRSTRRSPAGGGAGRSKAAKKPTKPPRRAAKRARSTAKPARPARRATVSRRPQPRTAAKPASRARKPAAKARAKSKPRPKPAQVRVATSKVKKAQHRTAAPPAKARTAPRRTAPPVPRPAPKHAAPPSARTALARNAALDRARRQLSDRERLDELDAPRDATPPPDDGASRPDDRVMASARSGRDELRATLALHTSASPTLTAGDLDAKWEDAYAVGDEAPGGDNPTPDQDRVDDIGRALGINYRDDEVLQGGDEITERDRHRWELDPASAEDYPEHDE